MGVTSRDVVDRVCAVLPRGTKVGHCGTLDPIATGVLLVCVGPATRLIQFGQDAEKRYVGDFRFGFRSNTEDRTGEVEAVPGPEITRAALEGVLPSFVGDISQRPPAFSALRVNGRRAYDLARKGDEVDLAPRTIAIHEIELTRFEWPDFQISIRCGSGTYVRSLGRDIAMKLETHAIMTELVRTGIGQHDLTDAMEMDDLNSETVEHYLLPGQSLMPATPEFVTTEISDLEVERMADGNPVDRLLPDTPHRLVAVDQRGNLIAVMRPWKGSLFTPKINFSKYWKARLSL